MNHITRHYKNLAEQLENQLNQLIEGMRKAERQAQSNPRFFKPQIEKEMMRQAARGALDTAYQTGFDDIRNRRLIPREHALGRNTTDLGLYVDTTYPYSPVYDPEDAKVAQTRGMLSPDGQAIIDVQRHKRNSERFAGEPINMPSDERMRKIAKKVSALKEPKLDQVGREDKDVNNNGIVNDEDGYLLNRRKDISQAIRLRGRNT
jgi:hypothetical protein